MPNKQRTDTTPNAGELSSAQFETDPSFDLNPSAEDVLLTACLDELVAINTDLIHARDLLKEALQFGDTHDACLKVLLIVDHIIGDDPDPAPPGLPAPAPITPDTAARLPEVAA